MKYAKFLSIISVTIRINALGERCSDNCSNKIYHNTKLKVNTIHLNLKDLIWLY